MLSTALNQQGATPGKPKTYLEAPVYNPNASTATPQSKALSNFSMASTPSTPVKKQVTTSPDGTKSEQYYDTKVAAPTSSPGSYKGVGINAGDDASIQSQMRAIDAQSQPQGQNGMAPVPQPAPAGSTRPTTASSTTQPTTFGGLIGQGAAASRNAISAGAQNYNAGASRLNELSQAPTKDYTEAQQRTRQAYDDAAKTNYLIEKAKTDALHNPNYSIDTGIGRAGQISQNYGLLGQNALTRAAGESAVLGATNTQQGLQQGAASAALSGGLSAQGQGISGLGTAAGLMSPTSNIILRDPTTGEVIGDQNLDNLAATQGRLSGIQSGASAAAGALGGSQAALTQAYQQGLAQIRAADNIEPQIVQTLNSNPSLNQTPISAITNLNQWFAGQTSDPAQQVLSRQVASYLTALGVSPDEAAQIAIQKGGTIGTILQAIKDVAVARTEASNPGNISGTGVGGSTGGGLYDF